MCWVCDQTSRLTLTQNHLNEAALAGAHYLTARASYEDGFVADGVGEKLDIALPTLAQLLGAASVVDNVPGDTSTTVTLTVGGPRYVSTINAPGDQDFYRVELEAGVTYEFGQYMVTGGPTGIPLADAYLELYDADGNLLATADGGGPFTPSGLDALLAFTPTASGTYYINARSYDELPVPDDNGDFVGDYEVFARISTYRPYYDLNSPLHSLDWGTQFDGTSRNPDGQEGPRPTGNEVENKIGGKNVIYVYFARQGDVFVDNSANPLNLTTTIVANGLQPWERQAFERLFEEYEKVADIDYVETEDRWAADIVVVTYTGTPGPGVSLLGRMSPPDTPSEGQTEYNSGDERWTQEGLAPGGFYFGTLIHEFGHGHGMAHPHDNGGRSSIMRGVEETSPLNYSLGDFDLNQGIYTMMSYQDGWQLSPYGQAATNAGYGFLGSLMAFDIAVIQDKYGVNEEWATGDDVYVIPDENVAAQFDDQGRITREATSYRSIWDAGGNDSIVYNGSRDAHIDLRAATLQYEYGGGGWVSYAWGIYGGFTIANGVVIENAYGGSGNDTLIGNDGNNILDGRDGVDALRGGRGDDSYFVDAADIVVEEAGHGRDIVYARTSYWLGAGVHVEVLGTANNLATDAINLYGNELDNYVTGNAGNNTLDGGGGADILWGREGDDSYFVDADDIVTEYAGHGHDIVYARTSYWLGAGVHVEVLGTANNAATDPINLYGNELDNYVTGNAGNNTLDGGGGADILWGREGDDSYFVDADDIIMEYAGHGHDIVYARTSYTLGAGVHVEVLGTANNLATDAINLTGNELANYLVGNAGSNILDGGLGADVLDGREGADIYAFTTALGGDNIDIIYGFETGVDKIGLGASIFAVGGALGASQFTTGSQAQDANDRIIYDSTTGALYYDADGSGAGAAVQFASVDAGLALTADDFMVFGGG